MHPFSRDLLDWYDAHRRTLPWRDAGATPYRTWVSEVMLQQTRVETVKPYFARWMDRFPTADALANAPLDDVLAMWSGLGYYSRARNLHKAAQVIRDAGRFPTDLAGVRALPGVGEYIAGAIGSIALGLDVPAVDGNLERVLARVHAQPGGRREMTAVAARLLPAGRAGDWNQALMDLGSGICTPRSPACPDCPVAAHCRGRLTGDPTRFPEKKAKKAAPRRAAVGAVLVRDGRVLLARRPTEGLFGGLYELPGQVLAGPSARPTDLVDALRARLGVEATVGAALGTVNHTLTHMRLELHVHAVTTDDEPQPTHYTALAWVDPTAPGALGLSTLARKALALAADPQQRLA